MALSGRLGRRLLLFAFVLSALASVVVPRSATAAPATQEPNAYILVDADTGKVIAAKNEHTPVLTASTVKLMTALVALERLPLNSTVPVSARAASQPAMKIDMHEGEVWKLDDALHALLIVSANDATFAIAERASGSIEQFAKDADATGKRLGLQNTTFGDPAGLDDAAWFAGGTHMSAYDLSIVARNALAVPEIANTSKLITYDFTDPAGRQRHLENHNKGFLTTYPGATGLKTGFTKAASRTLVTSATRDGRTMIAVVLGTWDDTGWAGFLLDQGFTTPATAPGTGVTIPKARLTTADVKKNTFENLPGALGRPALNGNAGAASNIEKKATTTPSTVKQPATSVKAATTAAAATKSAETATASTASTSSSGFSLGTVVNLRNLVLLVVVVLLALFLLRRRAVRRQRARRIARQQRMAEIRRRRMIDLVEPGDRASHVRVVPASPPRARSRAG